MKKTDYKGSSGNVFADLEVDAPEEALAKAELTVKISEIIEAKGLTQAAAAKVLGIDQPKVSAA
jgi:predicted XRE-type DNA-binding protein